MRRAIYEDDVINLLDKGWKSGVYPVASNIHALPSAQPDIAEKLYQYKCYITDQEGLQHEVIYVDDIRRVTGWEI